MDAVLALLGGFRFTSRTTCVDIALAPLHPTAFLLHAATSTRTLPLATWIRVSAVATASGECETNSAW